MTLVEKTLEDLSVASRKKEKNNLFIPNDIELSCIDIYLIIVNCFSIIIMYVGSYKMEW